MPKLPWTIGLLFLSLVITGAGCSKNDTNEPQTKSAGSPQTEVKDTTPDLPTETPASNNLTLKAEPAGKGRVHFSWTVPDGVNAKDGFRLVRGPLENPSYPGNFWFHRPANEREIHWINVPKGTQHFRVCAFENNACTAYSNDVIVTVE